MTEDSYLSIEDQDKERENPLSLIETWIQNRIKSFNRRG